MPANATPEEIQDRFDRLVKVVEESAKTCNDADAGTIAQVLFESVSKKDGTVLTGHSAKNQTVHVNLPEGTRAEDFIGRILPVRVTEAKTWYLRGEFAGN